MNSSEIQALSTPEYWNSRYSNHNNSSSSSSSTTTTTTTTNNNTETNEPKSSSSESQTPTHEWFKTYTSLLPFFKSHLFTLYPPTTSSQTTQPKILHLGSGDSTIPHDLQNEGYTNQICIDFSSVVVELMARKSISLSESGSKSNSRIEWKQADVRYMQDVIETESVDVAFDKGTLDAMIYGSPWSPPEGVLRDTGLYLDEVHRVLKPTGVFLYITYRQPHFMKPLLNRNDIWDMEMDVLSEEGGGFDYYGFILRKKMEKA